MLIKVKAKDIDLLTDENISHQCFEPLIKIYKKGISESNSSSQFKEQFYEQLTGGQKALFMFNAYYNHAKQSPSEFFWWSAYYWAQPTSWLAIRSGLKYFKLESLHELFNYTEQEMKKYNYPQSLESFNITREQLNENNSLQISINAFYKQLLEIYPQSVNKLNDYIKKNIEEFFLLVD